MIRSAVKPGRSSASDVPLGHLPLRMRILFITGPRLTGMWLADALSADRATEVELTETRGITAGMERLRDELFDAVLISHEPDAIDALDVIEGLRAGGDSQAIIVLGVQSDQEMEAATYEVGADAYVSVHTATTRALLWKISRALERHRLIAENRRLLNVHQHRLHLEHDEAARLLSQQRSLIAGLEAFSHVEPGGGDADSPSLPSADALSLPKVLVDHYRELLRTYVVMGSGSLTEEVEQLAELMASAGMSAHQTMLLHLQVLEEMVSRLGARSARHVLNRADLMVVEALVHLAENYRRRYRQRVAAPQQLTLPGFGGD